MSESPSPDQGVPTGIGSSSYKKPMFRYLRNADDPEAMSANIDAFNEIAEVGSVGALYIAGSVAIDAASKSEPKSDEQFSWIQRSSDAWFSAIKESARAKSATPNTIRAAVGITTLPGIVSIIRDQDIPPVNIAEYMYSGLIQRAKDTLELKKLAAARNDGEMEGSTLGILGELSVLLVHQRHVLREMEGDHVVALPALLSDRIDLNKTKPDDVANSWNISVYMDAQPEPPVIGEKIRVKLRRKSDDNEPESQYGISTIYVLEDLAVSSREILLNRVLIQSVTLECETEAAGTAPLSVSARLDSRAERLTELVR